MNIVKKYNELVEQNREKQINIELEIRKRLTLNTFLSLYEENESKPKMFKSSFSRSDSKIREESFYDNGTRTKKESMIKEKIYTEDFSGYKLNISKETPTDKVITSAIKNARIKFRWSFDILPKWIMDLTIVLELDQNKLTEMVKYYLFNQKSDNPKAILSFITDSVYYKTKPTILNFDVEYEYFSNSDLEEADLTDISEKTQTAMDQGEKNIEITELISGVLYPKTRSFTNLKDMLYNPMTLDRRTFLDFKQNLSEYTVAPKNDGERTLIIVLEEPQKNIIILNSTKLIFLGNKTPEISRKTTKYIIDSEMIGEKIMAFDLLYDGENLIDIPNSDYLGRYTSLLNLKKEISEIFDKLQTTGKKIQFSLNNVQKFSDLAEKEFYELAETKGIDGLIFTHFTDPNKVFKWKPLEHNTIDFLIVLSDKNLLGKYGFEKTDKHAYILCSGITSSDKKILGLEKHLFNFGFQNIQNTESLQYVPFMSSLDKYSYIWYSDRSDLDHKIGEFCLTGYSSDFEKSDKSENPKKTEKTKKTKKWELVRERPDRDRLVKLGRYYGNYYRIAEMTYLYYYNPVLLSQFYDKETNYFQVSKKDEYKTMIGFNNFVKENVLYQIKNSYYVIDLSSGKGQDIFRYNGFGVKNLLAVDQDKDAISELINRKYSLGNPNYYKYNRNQIVTQPDFTFIQARICDLSLPIETILDKLNPEISAKFVTMNLAIHYLLENRKAIVEFSKLVDRLLETGGTFIFSTFCGEKLMNDFERLKREKKPEKIEFNDSKFNITKVPNLNKIDVLHPFSDVVYRENIVNISEVISQFESLGFSLKQRTYFSEYLEKYSDYAKLTEDEKKYTDYYVYVSLKKQN